MAVLTNSTVKFIVDTLFRRPINKMEKFSRWRCPGTGIAPFLPTKKSRSQESILTIVGGTLKQTVVGPTISAAKLLIIAALGLVATVLYNAGHLLILPALKRPWHQLISLIFGRLALFLLGFYNIPTTTTTLKKSLREKQSLSKSLSHPSNSIQSGDIIIANHTSYIDILYFQTFYTPVFLHISSNGKCRVQSFSESLFRCGEYPVLEEKEDICTLSQISSWAKKEMKGPVVVFPEGTTTNGRGLIKFLPVLENAGFKLGPKDGGAPRFHVFGLKYEYEDYSPTYTIGGKLSHVIGLGAQFVNRLEVKKLSVEESNGIVSASQQVGTLGTQAATMVGQLLRLRMTSLSVGDKVEFFDFYKEREEKKRR
ncbi:hypothetical protein HDV05_004374 [Chytridiales sp. JEL 0842]|nr:hypothetical protein HDV05_004374 [Chytridiales sp. JEL 0842]